MSGGLDSNLAVRMIHDMGIEIIGVHFTGPFCMCNRGSGGCIHYAKQIAEELGIRFSTVGLGAEYMDIVVDPKHGRGSGMNACLDCRIMMFRRAKQMMEEEGASCILTGEVLGQRPMSQLSDKLKIIERETGLEGLIVRPLCAQHMPPTIAETEGWIPRESLLAIQGRGRRPQMDLAEKLHLGDYPCPAGGCLLTDKHFSARLREHIDFTGGLELSDIGLLKIGRHFRLPSGAKLVLGRDQAECEQLERMVRGDDTLLEPVDISGPSALLKGNAEAQEDGDLAGRIVATYCGGEGAVTVALTVGGKRTQLTCESQPREDFADINV